MSADSKRRFSFSDTCYFDMVAEAIVDTWDGKTVKYTVVSGNELIVLNRLIQAFPGSVTKELLLEALPTGSDNAEVRRVISELRKRHPLLREWIPRAQGSGYRLLDPLLPSQKPRTQPVVGPPVQAHTCTLKNTGICVRPNFVKEARADIFHALDEAFEESHVVFLQGIGGIGKSETAKHWALQKKKERLFDTIVFAQLNAEASNSNVQSLITDDNIFVISGAFRSQDEDESVEAYFHRKLAKIKQITDERTLIIIDNYDIDDSQMAKLFTGTYRVLVTTRNKQAGFDFPLIHVPEIQEPGHLKEIFFKNLGEERNDIPQDDPYIGKLFELVSNHTLTVEIIAKSLVNTTDTPRTIYQKISDPYQHVLMGHVDGVVVRNFSDEPLSPLECIRLLFSLSRLEKDKDYEYKSQVLVFMAAMPTRGIELSLFKKWSDSRIIQAKNSLVLKSWLRQDTVKGVTLISMHPLIREIVWHDLEPTLDKCSSITNLFIHDDCLYINGLYHQTKKIKDQYEQIALHLLSAFPVRDSSGYEFHIRLQRIFSSCANSDIAFSLINQLKTVLEQEEQTNTWKYGFINYRIASVHATLRRDRESSLVYFSNAEKLMLSAANTNEEKMWLALMYRERASTDCQDGNLFKPHPPSYTTTIEKWLCQGEALITEIKQNGFSNVNISIYYGTLCVWRSKLELYRGNLDRADELIDMAESEFARNEYINAIDKTAVEDIRAMIYQARGEYDKQITCLLKGIRVFVNGFSEYHRASIDRAIKLAQAYQNNGQPAEAIKVLTHYQKIAEEMLGKDAALSVTIRNLLIQLC